MAEPALDLGSRLQMARLRSGKSLHEVAAVTKIPAAWLEAIERNDFERLPGGIFRRAYIRAFAAEVGADPGPLPDLLLHEPEHSREKVIGIRRGESWRRHVPTVLALLLLVAAFVLFRAIGTHGAGSGETVTGMRPVGSAR